MGVHAAVTRYAQDLQLELRLSYGQGIVMTAIRVLRAAGLVRVLTGLVFVGMASLAAAQGTDLKQALTTAYPLTKATADNTDIVTAGAVLVLEKDNLQMCKVNLPIPTHNFYKNGEVTQGGFLGVLNKLGNASLGGGQDATTTRKFVAGEKFWVTQIQVENDGVTFQLLSDPLQDVRYHATLKFPFPKGQTPPQEQVLATVAQVIKADGDSGDGAPAPEQQQAAAGAAAPVATQTIALGQTKDQVVQSFGQPTKVVQLGAKEIDYYSDMKVTFTNNKVTNVE
jgi:hypothetical protein